MPLVATSRSTEVTLQISLPTTLIFKISTPRIHGSEGDNDKFRLASLFPSSRVQWCVGSLFSFTFCAAAGSTDASDRRHLHGPQGKGMMVRRDAAG